MPELQGTLIVTLPAGTSYTGKYELDLAKCTGLDDMDFRKETGFTIIDLLRAVETEPGLMLILVSGIAWLVRRRDFPHTTFEAMCASIPWGSDFTLETDEETQARAGKARGVSEIKAQAS